VAAPRLPSLLERLPKVKDPRGRNGRRHGWGSVLGVLSLAKLAGVPGCQRDIARFARRLTQPQRRQLGCWRNPDTGRYQAPSQSTIFRALTKVDYLGFQKTVLAWQDDWLGPADPQELVVLDGKTLINGGHQIMVSAIGVKSGRVYGVEPVRPKDQLEPDDRSEMLAASSAAQGVVPVRADPRTAENLSLLPAAPTSAAAPAPAKATKTKKENEIPAARRLLARADLAGKLVSLDALHTQHQTAAEIVLGCGADYLFTLKANQGGLEATAQTLVPGDFFPSRPPTPERAHGQDRRDQPGSARNPPVGDPPD